MQKRGRYKPGKCHMEIPFDLVGHQLFVGPGPLDANSFPEGRVSNHFFIAAAGAYVAYRGQGYTQA